MKAAVIGATGYGGAELIRLLQQHPSFTLHSFHSSSKEGESITASYPHLETVSGMELEAIDSEKIARDADVVFTATPSGVSSELVPELVNAGSRVIDLSGDFRLKDTKQYEQWYNKKAPDEAILENAVYGLTEWLEEDITEAQLISNPGCYPTAALLGLAPLLKQNIADPESIIIDAKTGVSGAGKKATPVTHFTEMNDNLKIYKVFAHQHTPEIEQEMARLNPEAGAVTFSTHLVPMTRGIMTTMYAQAPDGMTAKELTDLYQESYKDSYFVRVREEGTYPSTKEVYGSNFCDLSVTLDERTNRIMIVSVIDNLVKGASGQAVQNMNRMFGIDEKAGLAFAPVYP
ncbi:N-acetyl-gamma-glutamyl-phosphate reductase [Lentibacillus amyloliquefaciens]|uniref:N-acetyl-gamma-glutamyl-phosphate reductase n=1 Tax=Lentibacillus amyloliquefaciens TaxID=1472767 RepID=A0A0U4FL61_9BACI|nr:N-acetyl-gamma-glutamyl-phosphate reductase [Lentibacillus amyloliquefaciens]ALX48452.1 N-acetyl-gamma-glutamyl-phosphate reductase [Lentibacillus amyloliquefaciens]